jgi:hypothetical protein
LNFFPGKENMRFLLEWISNSWANWVLDLHPDRGCPTHIDGWWAPSHNAINRRWGPGHKGRGSLSLPPPTVLTLADPEGSAASNGKPPPDFTAPLPLHRRRSTPTPWSPPSSSSTTVRHLSLSVSSLLPPVSLHSSRSRANHLFIPNRVVFSR